MHSIAPNKVVTAGKVNVVCFDKTAREGTLPARAAPHGVKPGAAAQPAAGRTQFVNQSLSAHLGCGTNGSLPSDLCANRLQGTLTEESVTLFSVIPCVRGFPDTDANVAPIAAAVSRAADRAAGGDATPLSAAAAAPRAAGAAEMDDETLASTPPRAAESAQGRMSVETSRSSMDSQPFHAESGTPEASLRAAAAAAAGSSPAPSQADAALDWERGDAAAAAAAARRATGGDATVAPSLRRAAHPSADTLSAPAADTDVPPAAARLAAELPREDACALFRGMASAAQEQLAPLALVMAACHSLRRLLRHDGAAASLVGDPVEVQIFQATGWTLADAGNAVRSPAGLTALILHTFDFSSDLARMCTVVEVAGSGERLSLVKGAPERVAALCHPGTLPDDLGTRVATLARSGFRIVACAYRSLDAELPLGAAAAAEAARRLPRARAELAGGLTFAGLLVLENRLQEETPGVVKQLNDACIGSIMASADLIPEGCGEGPAPRHPRWLRS